MQIPKFPKIVTRLPLAEYAEQMEGGILVWVNLPQAKIREQAEVIGEIANIRDNLNAGSLEKDELAETAKRLQELADKRLAWLSEIWSQGPEETHILPDEILTILQHCQETDPRFFDWLVTETFRLITEHRAGKKKS